MIKVTYKEESRHYTIETNGLTNRQIAKIRDKLDDLDYEWNK